MYCKFMKRIFIFFLLFTWLYFLKLVITRVKKSKARFLNLHRRLKRWGSMQLDYNGSIPFSNHISMEAYFQMGFLLLPRMGRLYTLKHTDGETKSVCFQIMENKTK